MLHHLADGSRRSARLLAALVVVVLAAGLWSARPSEALTAEVSIHDFVFDPPEVTIRQGDSVTWTNHDAEAHAVQGGPMNSADIPPGGTFTHTFGDAGDFTYLCRLHTYMTGTVHVLPPGAPPSTTTTAAAPTTTSTTSTTTSAPTTTVPAGGGGDETTSTTATTAPPSQPSGGPAFQDVPDDPSATYPPGHPNADAPPPQGAGAAPTTTTTAPPPSSPGFQDVPDDDGVDDDGAGGGGGGHHAGSGGAEPPPDGPAGTSLGDGTFLAPLTTDGDVKVFELTMAATEIEVAPGVMRQAYAFNGVVPGPTLRVDEGDQVRIIVRNELPFATAAHWHGMILPNDQDGVPGVTQPAIEPGGSYTYEWTALMPGTHWYHSHSSGRHIGKGLYGMLEVVPASGDIASDRDYRLMLGDTDLGFTLNGRQFPSTVRLSAKTGERVRIRLVNAGDQVHAMHLHGSPFLVAAQDGVPLPEPTGMDTLTISPGQTFDLVAELPNPGEWLLHCHIFAHSHDTSDDPSGDHHGMNGMVTILDVTEGTGSDGAPAVDDDPTDLLGVLEDVGIGQAPTALVPAASSRGRESGLPLLATGLLLTAYAALTLSGLRRRTPPNGKEQR